MQPMLKTAVDAARTAGLVINRAALNLDQIKVSQKGLQDLVTEIDQDVEQILRERQLAARQRFDGAVAAAGPGLSDILWRVVCAGEGLPDAERALAWPVRSGKLVLRLALDRVAGFYRIS